MFPERSSSLDSGTNGNWKGRLTEKEVQCDTKKGERLKNATKIEEIHEKKNY